MSFIPSKYLYFNPRSHEGSDVIHGVRSVRFEKFQSTLPRRERHLGTVQIYTSTVFQSTLPRRERRTMFVGNNEFGIFQSTLPRRERLMEQVLHMRKWLFQSTLPRRERPQSLHKAAVEANFNPRSHEGSDLYNCNCTCSAFYFNPRSHEGSDCRNLPFCTVSRRFQSTLPRRERPCAN